MYSGIYCGHHWDQHNCIVHVYITVCVYFTKMVIITLNRLHCIAAFEYYFFSFAYYLINQIQTANKVSHFIFIRVWISL